MSKLRERLTGAVRRVVHWGDAHVPRGIRSGLGVLLMLGGVFGILPILGFWMIPAGLALIALDIPGWRRWLLAHLKIRDRHSADG